AHHARIFATAPAAARGVAEGIICFYTRSAGALHGKHRVEASLRKFDTIFACGIANARLPIAADCAVEEMNGAAAVEVCRRIKGCDGFKVVVLERGDERIV